MGRKTQPKPKTQAQIVIPEGIFEPVPDHSRKEDKQLGPMPEVTTWKTELTAELVDQLCVAARVGGFKKQSALACGVRPELLEWWLSEGMRIDAPPLMQELSARYQAIANNNTLALVDVIRRAAMCGEWEAAMVLLKHREPLWRGTDKYVENENAPPTTSLEERYIQLVEQLKEIKVNPQGDLARALKEAGYLPDTALPEDNTQAHSLLTTGKKED